VLAEIERLKSDPPTAEELKKAKDNVMNSFIFNYDTPQKTLMAQVVLALYATRRTIWRSIAMASNA